jgi:hypothetical protein
MSELGDGIGLQEAARLAHIHHVPGGRARCQLCGGGRATLIVFEPEIDRTNGQRITVAFCPPCVVWATQGLDVRRLRRELVKAALAPRPRSENT